jgi:hypothetical protein
MRMDKKRAQVKISTHEAPAFRLLTQGIEKTDSNLKLGDLLEFCILVWFFGSQNLKFQRFLLF